VAGQQRVVAGALTVLDEEVLLVLAGAEGAVGGDLEDRARGLDGGKRDGAARGDERGLDPAQLDLRPRVEVGRRSALAVVGAGGHEGPVGEAADRLVGAVVEVGEAELVAVLVREDAKDARSGVAVLVVCLGDERGVVDVDAVVGGDTGHVEGAEVPQEGGRQLGRDVGAVDVAVAAVAVGLPAGPGVEEDDVVVVAEVDGGVGCADCIVEQ